jgi:basic membrane protein A
MEFWAFKAGVESVNPNAKVYARVAGSWGDASLGYQIAKSLIQTKHVDIIVQIADLTGRGVIRAAQEFGIMVIGTCGDQSVLGPEATLTSIMMDTPGFMEMIVQSIMDGTFKDRFGGKLADVDLSSLAPFHNFEQAVPQEVKDLLKQTDDAIKNGTIVVPRTVTEAPPRDPK